MTDTAPPTDRPRRAAGDAALVRVDSRPRLPSRPAARWPASRSSRSTGPRRSTRSASTCSTSSPTRSRRSIADPACRAIVLTGAGDRAFAAGADIRELAAQTRGLAGRRAATSTAWDRIDADRPAAHRRGPRLRPRRRLRAGDGLRHDRRRRRRAVRPARDQDRGHARRRRHAAADPGDRQGPGDGADPDRPDDAAPTRPSRAGLVTTRRPGRRDASTPRSSSPRRIADDAAARRPRGQGRDPSPRRSCRLSDGLARRACRHSSRCSTPRTRPRGWRAFIEKRPPVWTGR